MRVPFSLCLLLSAALAQQPAQREAFYSGALIVPGQIMPLFANGYLVYLHQPDRLQVFRPDTQLAYQHDVPCPLKTSNCSVGGVAVSREGVAALGIAYSTASGYAHGIRLLDKSGNEQRFIQTGRYVPIQLAFDTQGDLWSIGWERDKSLNDRQSGEDYNMVRKYSLQGILKGEFLAKSLWGMERGPHLGGRGYWTMYASDNNIGAIFNEAFAGATPEWVEWDLNGVVRHRVPLLGFERRASRAFAGTDRLYAQFAREGKAGQTELRVLDNIKGQWLPVRSNLPDGMSAFLLGADGDHLVYRVNRDGNAHLVWARPD